MTTVAFPPPPSEHTTQTLSRQIARMFRTWRKTYPVMQLGEEQLRVICETALTIIESEDENERTNDL